MIVPLGRSCSGRELSKVSGSLECAQAVGQSKNHAWNESYKQFGEDTMRITIENEQLSIHQTPGSVWSPDTDSRIVSSLTTLKKDSTDKHAAFRYQSAGRTAFDIRTRPASTDDHPHW